MWLIYFLIKVGNTICDLVYIRVARIRLMEWHKV